MLTRSLVFAAVGVFIVFIAIVAGVFQARPTHSTGESDIRFQALSLGGEFTCAVTTEGHVMCWGSNGAGQLGNGRQESSSVPGYVCATGARAPCEPARDNILTGVTGIASGGGHACAVRSTGAVKCWGSNRNKQLGDGTNELSRTTPVDVVGLGSGVVSVFAGTTSTNASHNCALTEDGGVKCWGGNFSGQLGNASLDDSSVPVDVVGLESGVTVVAAGGSSSCAILAPDSKLVCWGSSFWGQVGDSGACGETCTAPVFVCAVGAVAPCSEDAANVLRNTAAVTLGGGHTCARVEVKPVLAGLLISRPTGAKCWGLNGQGQLGDGSTSLRNKPVDVEGLAVGVIEVSSGSSHTCAVISGGSVQCWGKATNGRLGNDTDGEDNFSSTPVTVCSDPSCAAPLTDIVHVAAGRDHTCAITSLGIVKCWGRNRFGQVGGRLSGNNELTPVDLTGLPKPSPTPTNTSTGTPTPTPVPNITATPTSTTLATSTPTATSAMTDTPTFATPTNTPVLPLGDLGDANCDDTVNSIDAALVLQLIAALLGSLDCQDAADVNDDGDITSVDAALILQFTAGLLSSLPP